MSVKRVTNISETEFIENYLSPGIPVVVTDAMKEWDIDKFSPSAMIKLFGNEYAQVYDDLFALQDVQTLEEYISEHFNQPESSPRCQRYVRWYTQLKDVDFLWADHIFEKIKPFWTNPYFLPNTNMIVPPVNDTGTVCPTAIQFPYKGLFVSARGSRTRLHRDPWHSNAILCQFYGEKLVKLYDRAQTNYVTDGSRFVDPLAPDLQAFPDYEKAVQLDEFILAPGEMVFFPRGVFHDVTCVTDSVSITWNFVHAVNKPHFLNHLASYPKEGELTTLRYFLKSHIPENADAEQIRDYVNRHFPDPVVATELEATA